VLFDSTLELAGTMLRFAFLLCLAWAVAPAAAFGAGNIASIAKVEGKNCTC
jgi:hypothetical protein